MTTHMVITTTQGKEYTSDALLGMDTTDIEQVRQQFARFDANGWHPFKTGGKVAYVRASAIESVELWEERER